jgi:hypothetical protein
MSRHIKRAKQIVFCLQKKGAEIANNAKTFAVAATTTIGAVASQAAVVYDDATNKLTGNIEMGPFYSGVGIAFAVIGAVLAVGLAISIVKRGK